MKKLLLSVVLFAVSPLVAMALTNGAPAIDLLGKYDDNIKKPGPIYGKGAMYEHGRQPNDAPNRYGLHEPVDVQVDSVRHRLFVVDRQNNRVVVYKLNAKNTLRDRIPDFVLGQKHFYGPPGLDWGSDISVVPSPTQDNMNAPRAVAYDSRHNRLFVADEGNARVLVYDALSIANGEPAINVLGQIDFISKTQAVTQSGMVAPSGVAYDGLHNRLFVSDSVIGRVLVFDVSNISNGEEAIAVLGKSDFISSSANTVISPTQNSLGSPNALVHDANPTRERLFVTDGNRVLVFNTANVSNGMNASNVLGQTNFISNDSRSGPGGISTAYGLAYDNNPTKKRLFVADGMNRVLIFDLSNMSNGMDAAFVLGQLDFSSTTSGLAQNKMGSPGNINYDQKKKRLYVSDKNNNRVLIFDVETVTSGENAIDALGQNDDNFLDPGPNFTKGLEDDGPNHGFDGPADIQIDTIHHRLFTLERKNNRILVYKLNNANRLTVRSPIFVLGQEHFYTNFSATSQNGVNGPFGFAYDGVRDRLFVADTSNNRVLLFDTANITNGMSASYVLGQPDFISSTAATTQSGMNAPGRVAYDPVNNRLFVSEINNNRVLVFNVAAITNGMNASYVLGQPNFTSNNSVTTKNGMSWPAGMIYDKNLNRLFVAEVNNNRALVFNLSPIANGMNASNVLGQPDFVSNTAATTQNGMRQPVAFAYDPALKRLFVSDYFNHRILTFDVSTISNGMSASYVLGQTNFTSAIEGNSQTLTRRPFGLDYDPANKFLYEVETGNDLVKIYDVQ